MSYFFYPVLFVFGLIIGSFLNVLICRYKPEFNVFHLDNLKGRSNCLYCKKQLSAFELIPIFSFLIQGGRCRACKHYLSLQYPIVEFLSGIIFAGIPFFVSKFFNLGSLAFVSFEASRFYYGLWVLLIFAFLTWLLIAAIDIKEYLVPDELNVFIFVLAILFVLIIFSNQDSVLFFQTSFLKQYSLLFSPFKNIFLNHVLGALFGFIFFVSIVISGRGKTMGFGDVKLALAAGLFLGWPAIGLAIVLSFIIGGFYGFLTILFKKKGMRDKVPFAPFFVLGIYLTVLFGARILDLYFNLFQI